MSQFPTSPAPSEVLFSSSQPTRVSISHSLRVNARTDGAQRWAVKMVWRENSFSSAHIRPIEAFLNGLRGRADSCTVVIPGRSTPRGTWTGTPLVRGPHYLGARRVISASVADGGSGGANGPVTLRGTTGNVDGWTRFYAVGTISGGAVTSISFVQWGGNYLTDPTNLAQEPVTATSGGAGLTGCKLAITMESWSGSTVLIDGLTTPQANAIKAGDFVLFSGHSKVYMVTADASVDAYGNAALLITPALRATLADNAGLTVSDVPFTMKRAEDTQETSVGAAFVEGCSVSFMEAF